MSLPNKSKKKPPVEAELAALHELRNAEPLPVEALKVALKHSSNAVAAKAANIIADRQATLLLADLAAAADRFFSKSDPGCMAKLAVVRALKALENTNAAIFQRALRHTQMENAYLGPVDTAAPLRAIAALAISECQALTPREALRMLIDALPDRHAGTRVDIVRAIAQVTSLEADAVLRTKARLGDEAPEVTGQVLLSLVEREGVEALAFVQTFLVDPELKIDAAMAIAACRGPEALEILTQAWQQGHQRDLLLAIGTLRTPEAVAWLLPMIGDEPAARKALEPCRHFPGVEDALAQSR